MPRRRNTRLEAEPSPFQAHRTGGQHRIALARMLPRTFPPQSRPGVRGRTEMQTRFGATRAGTIAGPGIPDALRPGRLSLIRQFRVVRDVVKSRGRQQVDLGTPRAFPRRPTRCLLASSIQEASNVASHANSQGCTSLAAPSSLGRRHNVCFLSAICLGCCVWRDSMFQLTNIERGFRRV